MKFLLTWKEKFDAVGLVLAQDRPLHAVKQASRYGRGGVEPTVTDANLVLGRLSTRSKLAGGMHLDLEASHRVIHDRLASPLGLSVEKAAEGMVRIVNATMVAANQLQVTAQGAVSLDTAVDNLTVTTSLAGAINVDETDAIVLTNIKSHDGSITVDAAGAIAATSVDSSTTDDGTNNIQLTTSSGATPVR